MTYTKAQIIFHWLTAAVLIVMVLTGLAYTYDWLDADTMQLHQIAGQILIVVVVARLIARFWHPATPAAKPHHPLEAVMAKIVHAGLYICLIAYLITGYIAASGLRDPLLIAAVDQGFARSDTGEWFLEAHFTLKWILLALFAIHIIAVLKHRFWDKDLPLSNMTLTPRKD
ncbi:hypothetical protein AL073_14840 [Loktanella sp. 1ANDIMAR09]|nr:hypothetical protein AL073_14840 [Loktanella sp. 1ANDIMAR09]